VTEKKKQTVEALREAQMQLQADIAERLSQFEADHGVTISNVTVNPMRTHTPDGDANQWQGRVTVRLSL
jgi:hypothetical protein